MLCVVSASGAGSTGGATCAASHGDRGRVSLPRAGVHLIAIASLAVALPLLDVLGRYPAFFAAHNVTRWGVVAFALVVLLGPAVCLFCVEAVVALAHRRAWYAVHLVWVGALSALLALTFVRRLGSAPAPTFAVSVALGALLAAAYARSEVLRSGCSVLALAPAVIAVLFLLTSNASSLVTAGEPRLWNARAASPAPVVVLVLDALPVQLLMDDQSRIDKWRFPSFARFARGATWYPNATTVHENTVFAVPAILDGKVPDGGQEPTVQDHPENLFTLLGNSYDMRVSEEATNLCPARLCERPNDRGATARLTLLADDASVVYGYLVAPDALRDRLPPINDRWRNFRDSPDTRRGQAVARNEVIARLVGGQRPQRFQTSVDAIRPGRRPTLDFMHVLLPHEPLEYLPAGQRYQAVAGSGLSGTPSYDNAFLTDQALQRHLLQVGFVDRLLGQLIAQLRRTGLWERAMVVVVADHGISFRVKPTAAPPFTVGELGYRRDLTADNAHDIAAVPLLVKYPGQRQGEIDPKWARTTDVLPTIADVLGIRLPFRVDGRSLRAPRPVPTTLRFRRSDGTTITIDRATLERRKAQSLARQVALLGNTWSTAYRIGPHPELIGRATAALPALPRERLSAVVTDAQQLAHVEPDSSYLPSHIAGKLNGADPNGRELAFALNGRIVSTGRSFAALGPHQLNFSTMLPPSAFRRGLNRIDIYQITPSRGRLALLPLGSAPGP
jgi:Sulfatase